MGADPCPKLPQNLDAERAVLGAVLLDNEALRPAAEILGSADFSLDAHRRIFTRIVALSEKHHPIDLITLSEAMERTGELVTVGGASYLAALTDGWPKTSNVEHYARIVKEKALLRTLIEHAYSVQQRALSPDADPQALAEAMAQGAAAIRQTGERRVVAVTAGELLAMDFPPREMVLQPVLPLQGLGMIYSWRGVGKTHVALDIADAVSSGRRCLRWTVPKPRPVLYVDGELPATTLRQWLASIIAGSGDSSERDPRMLRVITPDLQSHPLPDLATRDGQRIIEDLLGDTELLILDSVSALCRAGKEDEGESWLPMQEWALNLRRQGLAMLFIHHAGKAGTQRGTSRREDLLDVVIKLRHPKDYSPSEGLRCEVHFEKARGFLGTDAKPFEIQLESDAHGAAIWTLRDLEELVEKQAVGFFAEGLSVRDAAKELGISKSKAHRLKNRLRAEGVLP